MGSGTSKTLKAHNEQHYSLSSRSKSMDPVVQQTPINRARSPLKKEDAEKRNQEIEKTIQAAKIAEGKTVKLLLLGAGESGKSTIAKQMRILHANGFAETDLINIRFYVQSNIVTIIDQLIIGLKQLKLKISAENQEDITGFIMFKSSQGLSVPELNLDIAERLNRLWHSPTMQECYDRRQDVELLDSAKYFMDNIMRIAQPSYKPTEQDALRCRVATTGIHETKFQFKNRLFRLIDVGGQRSERRKWIHCFEDVTAILFVTAMSEYNQTLFEDATTNRMLDSLELFGSIVHLKSFAKTPVIIFLNKKDLFAEKILKFPISDYFPEYKGSSNYEECCDFVKGKYMEKNQAGKAFYVHYTNATDTENVKVVFTACMDIVLKKNLAAAGVF